MQLLNMHRLAIALLTIVCGMLAITNYQQQKSIQHVYNQNMEFRRMLDQIIESNNSFAQKYRTAENNNIYLWLGLEEIERGLVPPSETRKVIQEMLRQGKPSTPIVKVGAGSLRANMVTGRIGSVRRTEPTMSKTAKQVQ